MGNVINITGGAGFTAGRYEVLAIAGVAVFLDCASVAVVSVNSREMSFLGCRFHDNLIDCVTLTTGRALLSACLFYVNRNGSTMSAVTLSGAAMVEALACTIYNCGAFGIDLGSAPLRAVIANCVFESNNSFAVNLGAAMENVVLLNCAYFGNGGKYQSANIPARNILGEQNAAASAFVNAAARNFALNNTAGAGALLRAAAFPSLISGGGTQSYLDIGGAQHQDSGGGGVSLRRADMDGGTH